jgi:hypothetical protein
VPVPPRPSSATDEFFSLAWISNGEERGVSSIHAKKCRGDS